MSEPNTMEIVEEKAVAVKEAEEQAKKVAVPSKPETEAAPASQVVEKVEKALPTVSVEKVVIKQPVAAASVMVGDAAKGAKISRKCSACHTFDKGGKNKTGPNLFAIVGARQGAVAGFRYGDYLKAQNASGASWDMASLKAWLEDSKAVAKAAGSSTKMPPQRISGSKADDLIAYMKTLK